MRVTGELQIKSPGLGPYIGKVWLVNQQNSGTVGRQVIKHKIQTILILQDVIHAGNMQHRVAPPQGMNGVTYINHSTLMDDLLDHGWVFLMIVITQHCDRCLAWRQQAKRGDQVFNQDLWSTIMGSSYKIASNGDQVWL
jgi:hypothetical protein